MKQITLWIFTLSLLFSCNNDTLLDSTENGEDISLRSAGDNKYDVLGYGYNITANYFDYSGTSSAPVIDMDALKKKYPNEDEGAITSYPGTHTSFRVVGETASQFSTNLTAKTEVKATIKAFGGTLSSSFGSSENYDNKYSIACHESFYRFKQLSIILSPSELIPFLTTQFKNDLNNLSSAQIVQKYGTHVLTDITVGARLEIMYKAISLSSNKTSTIDASLSASVGLFSSELKTHYDKSLATQNKNYTISYKTIGGDPTKVPGTGTISVDPTTLPEINIAPWVSSIQSSNYKFIDSKPGSLIRLSDLVEDPAKKASLSAAIDKFILDGEISTNTNQIREDWSGQVQIILVKKTVSGEHPTTYVEVPEDYVVIGGGAKISGYGKWGALLTKSYPSQDLTKWYAESKDHIKSDKHTLDVYAIGLKIKGITRDQLKGQMIVTTATSSKTNWPATQANLPAEYTLIGGGAAVNWSGQGALLVKSAPNGNSWSVSGKDHKDSSPATITAYAIGIKPNIDYFGTLEISRETDSKWVSSLKAQITAEISSDWLLACPGGEASFSGEGRMLTILEPNFRNVVVESSDHIKTDSGNTTLSLIKIRKKK